MSKKNNKKTAIPANIKTNKEKVARSFLEEDNEQQFKWAIRSDKIDCTHEVFGFNCEAQETFVYKIKPVLDSYTTMTWNQVIKRKSCHYIDVSKLEKDFQDRIYELYNDNAPETLFQIQLTAKHRIFGLADKGVFYILFNDPNHLGYIVEKKNT